MNVKEKRELKELYDKFSGLLDGLDPIGVDDEATPVIIEIGEKFEELIGLNDFNIAVECDQCGEFITMPEHQVPDFKYCPNGDCNSNKFIFYKRIEV